MAAAATLPALYETAVDWEGTGDRERHALKEFIKGIVGYPCKVACKECDGVAEVYVMSERSGRIEDWIEIHENGAIWPIEEIYEEKRRRLRDALVTACGAYNDAHGVDVPEDDEEEDDESEDEESSSEESHVVGEDDEEDEQDEEDDESDESDA
jgi:hypothetical protein